LTPRGALLIRQTVAVVAITPETIVVTVRAALFFQLPPLGLLLLLLQSSLLF
jgi:hypothetical protein